METTWIYEKLSTLNDKMYEFIIKYHLVDPLDDDTFSSYSMFLAFAVLYPGANGETKKQLEKVFGFNEISNDFEKSIAYLLNVKGDNDTIALENTLWIDKKFTIKKGYEESIKIMQSITNTSNFSTQPEEERVRINKHVEKITHNLIKDLIPQNTIDASTPLVITNALYFRDKWFKQFELLRYGIQFKDIGEVKSMKVKCQLQSSVSENVTIVSIPYEHDYYMTIIMPTDMKSYEQSSDFTQINELITTNFDKLTDETELKMPLFKLDKTSNLKERLIKLGLVNVFKSTANFNAISDNLYIDNAFHKTYICVNEKETEAAAATAMVGGKSCAPRRKRKIIHITIDKPFFAIISGDNSLPLFFSKVTNPEE